MRTVSSYEVATDQEATSALPERVQEALGELAGAAKEGLLVLSVGVGLGVLAEMMEAEVDEVVGPKGKHNANRTAVRHGHDDGEVTLGGRRVSVERPRARAVDGSGETELETYRHFADRDPLTAVVLERMLAGVLECPRFLGHVSAGSVRVRLEDPQRVRQPGSAAVSAGVPPGGGRVVSPLRQVARRGGGRARRGDGVAAVVEQAARRRHRRP